MEVIIIVILGAITSMLNTLWLRNELIIQIEKIAKRNEENIIRNSKVTDISDRRNTTN